MQKSPVHFGRGFCVLGAESARRGRTRGQRRNRRAGEEHRRAGWAVRCGHPDCGNADDTLIRAPCATPSYVCPCATLSYGRPSRLSTYVRPRTIPVPPPLSGITGRGGARSGSPSALDLCQRPCLCPCRDCGRRTIRSGGSAVRAAATRSRAGASAGRPA